MTRPGDFVVTARRPRLLYDQNWSTLGVQDYAFVMDAGYERSPSIRHIDSNTLQGTSGMLRAAMY